MVREGWPGGLDLGNFDAFASSYAHTAALFPTVELRPGIVATNWRAEGFAAESVGQVTGLRQELGSGRVAAVTILRDGRVAYRWGDGQAPRLLMSVSKVVASLALGHLVEAGRVDPDEEIRGIVPELSRQWTGCRVRHVWDMASGVQCPEVTDPAAYTDPTHPFYAFEASLGWRPALRQISPYELVSRFGRSGEPGRRYEYTSVNTFLLAWIIERRTGLGYTDALQQLVWGDLALGASTRVCVNDAGVPVAHGGIVMSVDDLARFAAVLTPSAPRVGHRRSAPQRYTDLVCDPRSSMDLSHAGRVPPGTHPGCQWNMVWSDNALFKSGFGGQGLYVDPEQDVIIAFAGAPDTDGRTNHLADICRGLAYAVRAY